MRHLVALVLLPAALAAGCFLPSPAGTAPNGGSTPVPSAPVIAGARPAPPPWAAPGDDVSLQLVQQAGLEEQPGESDLYHIHAYLTVFWDGQPVTVPGNVGIARSGIWISPLHTHGTDGVLHIEAPKKQTITISQFFKQWNVALTGASVYDDGKPVADGANLALRDRQAIAVVWGAPPPRIPDTYPYPAATPAPNHPGATASP